MIKTNELRIGNIVNYTIAKSTFQGQITAITTNRLVVDKVTSKFMNVYGIELNEEWLLKLGFEEKHQIFQKDGLQVDGTVVHFSFDKWRSNYDIEHCDFVEIPQEIKYVNQLQNLYFALTGCELQYVA